MIESHVQQDTDFSNTFNGVPTHTKCMTILIYATILVRAPAVLIFFLRHFALKHSTCTVFVFQFTRHDASTYWCCSYTVLRPSYARLYKVAPFLMIYALLKFFHKRFFLHRSVSPTLCVHSKKNLNKFRSYKLLYGERFGMRVIPEITAHIFIQRAHQIYIPYVRFPCSRNLFTWESIIITFIAIQFDMVFFVVYFCKRAHNRFCYTSKWCDGKWLNRSFGRSVDGFGWFVRFN